MKTYFNTSTFGELIKKSGLEITIKPEEASSALHANVLAAYDDFVRGVSMMRDANRRDNMIALCYAILHRYRPRLQSFITRVKRDP